LTLENFETIATNDKEGEYKIDPSENKKLIIKLGQYMLSQPKTNDIRIFFPVKI